jgi:Flp pilus assembly protein TadD
LFLLDGKADAWAVLSRALELSPTTDVYNDAATAAIQLRRFTQAIKLLRKALALSSENPLALNNMGVCAIAQGDAKGAERYFRSAVLYDRNCFPAIHNLAESFIRRNAFEDADDLLDEHLRRHPDDFQAKERLAWARFSRGKTGKAIDILEDVNRRLAGKNPAILNNLAVFHEAKLDFTKAAEYFRKAIALNSTAVNIRENLAGILAAQGQWEEIIHVLPGMLAAQSAKAVILLGLALHYMQRSDEAIEWLTQYLTSDANNPRVTHLLGFLLIQTDELEKAIVVLQEGSIRFPTDVGIMANLAYALLKRRFRIPRMNPPRDAAGAG